MLLCFGAGHRRGTRAISVRRHSRLLRCSGAGRIDLQRRTKRSVCNPGGRQWFGCSGASQLEICRGSHGQKVEAHRRSGTPQLRALTAPVDVFLNPTDYLSIVTKLSIRFEIFLMADSVCAGLREEDATSLRAECCKSPGLSTGSD